jgi:hypothetical protein
MSIYTLKQFERKIGPFINASEPEDVEDRIEDTDPRRTIKLPKSSSISEDVVSDE